MTNWTRAHDAWIAEKCEGRKILGPGVMYHDERGGEAGWHEEIPIPHYLADPAAAIRAAEAWRRKKVGRWWNVQSAIDGLHPSEPTADCWEGRLHWTGEALAQALYRATGGPA